MSSRINRCIKEGLITDYPSFLKDNIHYEVMMGSVAYGCSSDTSDMDIYGFCIPPKDILFPHLSGVIYGFDNSYPKFDQYQKHHVIDKDANKEYDFSIYNIIKYFRLVTDNNPNMIDSLFVSNWCVLHETKIGQMVREKRKIFLHKGCYWKFKGYAYSQMHKMITKNPEGKRKDIVEKYGFDIKFAMHTVRLLNECEQILSEHNIDLLRSREQLKAIRKGEVPCEEIQRYFYEKESQLEKLYNESTLPYSPDEKLIKQLLIDCLEEHYGSLEDCISKNIDVETVLNDIETLINKYRR
uniref:Putative nucleotidyltransferase n=1 Tax=viral metagenome TaxID=1070528 RepID=A0A6M3LFB2_9ZZZZ